MTDEIIVKRYADAFIGYARDTLPLEKILKEVSVLKGIIRDNAGFMEILENPSITVREKESFLEKVLTGRMSDETRHLLNFLLEWHRIDKLPDILEYIRIRYSHPGVKDVVISSAYPLDIDLVKKIEETVEEKLGRCKFYLDLNGDLLGGIRLTVGNIIMDGSVKKRLEDLKDKLLAARV